MSISKQIYGKCPLNIRLVDLPHVDDEVAARLGATTVQRYLDDGICEFTVQVPLPETISLKIGYEESVGRPGGLTERGYVTDIPIAEDKIGQVEIYKSGQLYYIVYTTDDPRQPMADDVLSHIEFVLEHARAQKDEYTYEVLPPLEKPDGGLEL